MILKAGFSRAPLAILMALGLCAAGGTQPREARVVVLGATVLGVTPLDGLAGTLKPVGIDPRFVLKVRVISSSDAVSFSSGAKVNFGIHSPALLFHGDPTIGKAYEFVLYGKTERGKRSFDRIELKGAKPSR